MAIVHLTLDEMCHLGILLADEVIKDKATLEAGEANNDPDYMEILINDIQLCESILEKLNS